MVMACVLGLVVAFAAPAIGQDEGEIEDLTANEPAEAAAEEAGAKDELADPGNAVPTDEATEATTTPCRVWVPGRREWQCREVTVPAVTRQVCVPVYEDVEVPVHERRCVTLYREMQVPTYDWVEVPVTTCRRVPVYEDVEVPVYERRCVPVTEEVCDPRTGETVTVTCGMRVEVVENGTRTQRCFQGWRTEEVPCGTRRVRQRTGTETVRVACGRNIVTEVTGTRTERRLTGYRTECVEVAPATTRTVRECVCVPGHWATR
jgi:hypothetical protein